MVWVLVNLVVGLVVALFLIGFFTRRATHPAEVASWARSYGLALTDRNCPPIRYFVQLSITTRVIGGVAGLFLGGAFDQATGLRTARGVGWWAWVVGCWVFGAMWAERELRWPQGQGVASLLPRRTADYLPRYLRVAPFAVVGLTAVLAAGGRWLPVQEAGNDIPATPTRPGAAYLLTMVALAGLVALVTTGVVRRIVGRRQPPLHPDLLAADDAVRTNVAHQVAGGGTAVGLLLAAVLAGTLGQAFRAVDAGSWFELTGLLLLIPALVAWRFSAYRSWRVRRAEAAAAAARPSLVPS